MVVSLIGGSCGRVHFSRRRVLPDPWLAPSKVTGLHRCNLSPDAGCRGGGSCAGGGHGYRCMPGSSEGLHASVCDWFYQPDVMPLDVVPSDYVNKRICARGGPPKCKHSSAAARPGRETVAGQQRPFQRAPPNQLNEAGEEGLANALLYQCTCLLQSTIIYSRE